jgi:uncharacterized protein YprB with RNaseH-like and TPR domain
MVIAFDIETTGLNPHENQVVVIGMKIRRKIRLWKLWEIRDEAKMILDALEEIERTNETIIGYNNLKFDVPFMLERLRILGKYEPRFWKIHSKKWFDLYQYLGNDYRSLRHWLQQAKIKSKYPDLDGKNMPNCFERKDFEKIVKHNIDDLTTSEKLFKYLKKMNPQLIPFS